MKFSRFYNPISGIFAQVFNISAKFLPCTPMKKCPLSKGNQAPTLKFESPYPKSVYLSQELVRTAHLKAQLSDFFEDFN